MSIYKENPADKKSPAAADAVLKPAAAYAADAIATLVGSLRHSTKTADEKIATTALLISMMNREDKRSKMNEIAFNDCLNKLVENLKERIVLHTESIIATLLSTKFVMHYEIPFKFDVKAWCEPQGADAFMDHLFAKIIEEDKIPGLRVTFGRQNGGYVLSIIFHEEPLTTTDD
jgi:hypothetical protein